MRYLVCLLVTMVMTILSTSSVSAKGNALVRTVLCASAWEKGTLVTLYAQYPEYREICPPYVEAYKQTHTQRVIRGASQQAQARRHTSASKSVRKQPTSVLEKTKVPKVVESRPVENRTDDFLYNDGRVWKNPDNESGHKENWCHDTILTHPDLRGVEFCVDSSLVSDARALLNDSKTVSDIIIKHRLTGKRRWDITSK